MTKYFIAKAIKGQEFMFDFSSPIAVPESSRQKICDALNKLNYQLKEGQIWHIYENDYYYDPQINYEIKRFGKQIKIHRRCA